MMKMIKFLLVTLVVVLSGQISSYADKGLMIRECHNARVPTICMQCLESDRESVHADPVGIASIVIKCLDSNLNVLTKQKEKDGDAIKIALEGCKKDLSEAIRKALSDAKKGLKTGDYDKAGQSIKHVLGFPLMCKYNLQTAEFDFTPFYSQINIYAQLSDATMRIIDRF
ncbi:PREDICTED: pectinesterase inhibitor [Brassica oleracea var. oleracea]|uniref:pectinesterase inhibitor n=1 Tax=Brassica oleracea var. oleracea TaxID=109376 RepID=UPI0006A6D423|nr:PREDICTED: pectinesterase inhibitor [Brassica oleracea var. oleracea]